jgi:isopenicillin-N N-acyltransferase-like protein
MEYLTLSLQGDHYTQGRQHGHQAQSLRPQIAKAMADQVRRADEARREVRREPVERDGAAARFERLLQETRELLQELDAPLLDLIRGQAEALEFEFDTLLNYSLGSYLYDVVHADMAHADMRVTCQSHAFEGCTTWAATGSTTVAGADGTSGPLLAKNRDYRPEHLPLQVVIQVTPQRGYRYVCSGSAGSPGVFCAGINQAGLAVADTHVTSTDVGPGLPDYSLMMHLLEEHDCVSSALDYLRAVPRMGRNNLILADARGHLAIFEIGHHTYGLFEAHDGMLVNTNHFASPELRGCFVDTSEPQLKGNSFQRHEEVTRALEAALGKIDVPFGQRLMATHAGPLASICRHPGPGPHPGPGRHLEEGRQASTISASIFLPARRAMLFCHGLPCQGRYDEFVL